MKVSYYRGQETGRNERAITVVFGIWPAPALEGRGLSASSRLFERDATPAEIQASPGQGRLRARTYPDAPSLLEDEASVLIEVPEVFRTLKQVLHE